MSCSFNPRIGIALVVLTALPATTLMVATPATAVAAPTQVVSAAHAKAPSAQRAKRGAAWKLVYNRRHAAAGGAIYRASALVRAPRKGAVASILVRQVVGNRVTASRAVAVHAPKRTWKRVTVAVRTSNRASNMQVFVKGKGKAGNNVRVRQVRFSRMAAVQVAPPPASANGWRLDMNENFDSIAPSRWNVRNATYLSYEQSHLLARNVTVDNGALRIQAKREAAGGRSYTSGYIESIGKYSLPNYFRAEVRAKVPFQQGLWAAPLWFRPTDGRDGEIDLVETYGKDRANPTLHQTIHTEYGATHRQVALSKRYAAVSSAPATDWHIYTIQKTPNAITMWVDGVKTAVFHSSNPSWFNQFYEAGKRWNLRVNMQIGGNWGGSPDSSTDWRADTSAMKLDYIRTWVPR